MLMKPQKNLSLVGGIITIFGIPLFALTISIARFRKSTKKEVV